MATIVREVRDEQFELLVDDDVDKTFIAHVDQIVKFDDKRTGEWGIQVISDYVHHIKVKNGKNTDHGSNNGELEKRGCVNWVNGILIGKMMQDDLSEGYKER